MESLNFQEVIPLGYWAFSSATGLMIILISMFLYLYYRKRLQAVVDDGSSEAELAGRVEQLRKDEDTLRAWIAGQKDELLRLTAERQEQELLRAELQRLEQECATNEEHNRTLRNEVGNFENQKYLLGEKSQKLEQEITSLKVKKEQLQDQMNELGKSIELSKTKNAEYEKRCSDLESLQKQKNNELETAERTLREARSDTDSTRFEHDSLRKKIDSLKEREQEIELLNGKLFELKQNLDDVRHEVSNQQRLNQSLREEADKIKDAEQLLKDRSLGLEQELNELRQKIDQFQEQRDDLVQSIGQTIAESKEREQECNRLANLQEQKKSELQDLIKESRAVKNEIDSIRFEHDSLRRKVDTLSEREHALDFIANKILELEQDLAEARDEVATQQRLKNEVAQDIKEKKQILNELKAEEVALNNSIDTLKLLAEQEKKSSGSGKDVDNGKKYHDLWQPVTFPSLLPANNTPGEQELLQKTSDYIKAQSLYFPERVLHAFHTALKVNDISPLVVLAGISGTGKSELPRRYAEGMGMHSVILAVQPRWDSPQDLFGFYNYLEERYKATELARAMVQFEQFNRPEWPLPEGWDHDRSDRMLLVLLDEMNLARVEYYFSEFLSRLETRRGITLSSPEERAKAEIALEMGSLAEGENPIKLFPGQNVLFSGTMNEDETTQALSDKVLDRSCVLRFGRPKQIKAQEHVHAIPPTADGLTFEQWKTFLKNDLPAEENDRVNSWINKLNAAMEQLDRPFGHRVAQAIQKYVANYPRWIPNRVNLAMADQIEQRIMPKLRGIEISEMEQPLREIHSVIKDCEDEALSKAFDQGSQSEQQVFIWRGLDRTEDFY